MTREQAREILSNLLNQITAKKSDHELLEKALDVLYYTQMEDKQCEKNDLKSPF